MELGHMLFGPEPGAVEMSNYAEAAFWFIHHEIKRIYWNKNQKEWDGRVEDPELPGITWNAYDWDGASDAPNFAFDEVKVWWYKYPGRGMTCNVDWDANQWAAWMDKCLAAVRKADRARTLFARPAESEGE